MITKNLEYFVEEAKFSKAFAISFVTTTTTKKGIHTCASLMIAAQNNRINKAVHVKSDHLL